MRILHLLAPASFGGLETVVETLARAQVGRGHEVAVAMILDKGSDPPALFERVERMGADPLGIRVGPRGYLRERRAVRRLIGQWRPDVVHTHGYRVDVVDAAVCRNAGIPVVTTVHGFTGGGLKNRSYEWLQRRAYRKFHAVLAVSDRLAGELRESGVADSIVHTVRNAWAPPDEILDRATARSSLGLPETGPVIGWIGRFSREKGPDLMIRAFGKVKDRSAVLAMVGVGSLDDTLRDLAEDLQVFERIRWLGAVQDAARFMRAFDVMALTSHTEGSPMVILEAMAAETPVVARAVGGIPEILSEKEATLIFTEDTEDEGAFAASLDDVLSEPEVARSRARMARKRLEEEFAVGPWVDRVLSIYSSLLAT